MSQRSLPTRTWTVLAQDPSVLAAGNTPLLARVRIPAEALLPGPRGHRVQVIDYDPASDTLYKPRETFVHDDPWAERNDISAEELLQDPHFHAQNVYAIAMATLQHFETALGRRVHWAFASGSAQIRIAPHGIAEANAFYSRRDEALVFGYFPSAQAPEQTVFTCLSHDIVAHETSHGLIDGLRPHFFRPSSPDQIAFHEGLADLVAILSVFRLPEVVRHVLDPEDRRPTTIAATQLTIESLQQTALLRLAEEMGGALSASRSGALRASASLEPSVDLLDSEAFREPHRRGEILVAAVLHSFLAVWQRRLFKFADAAEQARDINLNRAVEEGARSAAQLLTIAIRALDYTPPVDIHFRDYLSALLTADQEACPDDTRYRYRELLREWFARFGIEPASRDGVWQTPPKPLQPGRIHFDELRWDRVAGFRLLWENRRILELDDDATTVVDAIHPITKISPDGFVLRETVLQYRQTLEVRAAELMRMRIRAPDGMPADQLITLSGGGTLLFDEFGQLKFHIGTGVRSSRQGARLASLWRRGYFDAVPGAPRRFALLHRLRGAGPAPAPRERW